MLGTTYMRMILEGLDNHPVLASAAYNAGPGRARKWKDARPPGGRHLRRDHPLRRTRDYKKVMANSVIYAALLDGGSAVAEGASAPSRRAPAALFSGLGSPAPGAGLETAAE